MALSPTISADLLSGAVEKIIRTIARDLVLPRFGALARHEIGEKSPGEVVTIVDREVEHSLSAELAALLPGSFIVGEEACADDPTLLERVAANGLTWLIDPLDGTANFAAGREPFGIIIALVQDGETEMGWLYDPTADRMCAASRGGGATIDGVRFVVSSAPASRPVAALATQFMDADRRTRFEEAAKPLFDLVPIPRCAAEHYPRVCLGTNDVAMFQRTLPWDHAAGVLFLTEAGGHAARWDGSPYRPGENGSGLLVARTLEHWQQAYLALFG